ncbi:helix-turn-helix domain-containing protein [Streptomyces jumonjinensis]|uniref:Helix-turn-helix domain-containing protein n=1 Tax=Streptomyces jumonjinensis TaxID=1945 RepID=A0A646KT23_STRJU|nr:helix-turn-helix domain-containing protein [Streptomyces jumonjinensis]MQT05444.1 hypothetical protein [Streptomyces jumonjinensis]
MSIHLMVVVAYLPKEVVNKTQKLVLMKIADSADDQTRLGRPGLERMMAWAGVGEKQVSTVVTELVGLGLVERTEVGRVGRRAEYKVFPYGVPPIPSTEELIERRVSARNAPKNSRLARDVPRSKPSAAARTRRDVAARQAAKEKRGDAGFPDGNPVEGAGRVSLRKPDRFPGGNRVGSPGETPSLPPPSSSLPYPPTPAPEGAGEPDGRAEPAGGPRCPKHREPVANCRGCGTNPRAGREQARRRADDAKHRAQQEWLRQFFEEQQRRVAATDPQALEMARQRAMELARMGRGSKPDSRR